MQHVLLGKQSSLYYSKFPQIESDHNEATSTNDISAADLSTNMNSVSLTSAEIYIGDMFEWKGNVYEIKLIKTMVLCHAVFSEKILIMTQRKPVC